MSKTIKILIIEDELIDQKLIKRAINNSGIISEVHIADNAHSAFEMVNSQSFDCIFIDYLLPELNGIEVVKKLVSMNVKAAMIVITSQTDEQLAELAIAAGATNYLTKNLISPEGISLIIRNSISIYEILHKLEQAYVLLSIEKEKSEQLILNILPKQVAEELKMNGEAEAHYFKNVTVLFTDFKNFTGLSEQMTAKELVQEINHCFSAFDQIMEKYNIEKIKTIGDSYMAAGGLPVSNNTHALDVVYAALEIQKFMLTIEEKNKKENKLFFEIRIGIHTGPLVAGVVGTKKFQYDIWGDTVNLASRMESSSQVGEINISEQTHELIKDEPNFSFEARGEIKVKGKGKLSMYFVKHSKDFT